MKRETDGARATRARVEWTARQIHDPLWRLRYLQSLVDGTPTQARWRIRKAIGLLTLLALVLVVAPLSIRRLGAVGPAPLPEPGPLPIPRIEPARMEPEPVSSPQVWQVEKTEDFETYSNGLRIENQFAVGHLPRAYMAFSNASSDGTGGENQSDPVGIVYHTTESLQAPFEPSQNQVLKRVAESLIEYVRRRRCYNFLVDRFGRVFRIVRESDAADHAGHSVWADEKHYYIGLNDSFLGVSFEAETEAGETLSGVSPAQIHAAAMLTEMLRSRYKIPAGNCVTHAQVSVNPSNMQIGYHVDWASSFPFDKLGLPDNYAAPSPAVSLFGFAFDGNFEQRAGVRLAAGALRAERALVARAQTAHLSLPAYRKTLQQRYLRLTARHRR